MFLITTFLMNPKPKESASISPAPAPKPSQQIDLGHINTVFSEDL